jgi:DNA-binding HxlR family transcriptional regulator
MNQHSPKDHPNGLSFGPCNADCPVARAHQVLGGKWTTLIFRELLTGRKRYSELQRGLAGISPRMLAERLKMLEQRRLLVRTQYETIPPATDYRLTGLGMEMAPVIRAMAVFGGKL